LAGCEEGDAEADGLASPGQFQLETWKGAAWADLMV
jgi:hypothetical protein